MWRLFISSLTWICTHVLQRYLYWSAGKKGLRLVYVCVCVCGGGGVGVTGVVNCGTGVRASISKPIPFIYLAYETNGRSHILDHPKCWLIHILTFDCFCTHLFLVKYRSQFIKYQVYKQPRKISKRKICAYTRMSEKWGLSHRNPEKSDHSFTRTSVLCHIYAIYRK